MRIVLSILTLLIIQYTSFSQNKIESNPDFTILKGPYLGQNPPGMFPEIFAPELVKNCPSFTLDQKEIYFRGQKGSGILFMLCKNDKWTTPMNAFISNDDYSDFNPYLSPDGQKLVFASNRPDSMSINHNEGCDIFISKRTKKDWDEPQSLGSIINSNKIDGCPTIAESGNLYFFSDREGNNDIYISRFIDEKFTKPEKLSYPINTELDECDSFIAPDESFIIVCMSGREDCFGNNDLYISFKKNETAWTKPINMKNGINTEAKELFPRLSPDGKYLFFTSNKDGKYYTYWINAKIIDDLKPKYLK